MQEDTKPENDDIQDEERKKPFSRSEYHGVITSYAGLALSLIAIILSVITMYQSHMMETREIVQILRAEDDGYYHFDGEKLFKNFQVTVANNSAIPVSVVEITIERDGEARTFKISDLSDILPLNMESNHTKMITISWNIELSEDELQIIREYEEKAEETESDTVLSSKSTEIGDSITSDSSDSTISDSSDKSKEEELKKAIQWAWSSKFPKANSSESENTSKFEPETKLTREQAFLWLYKLSKKEGIARVEEYIPETLTMSVTLRTAKNNQYILTTQDTGVPKQAKSEGAWVAERIITENSTLAEFIHRLYQDKTESLTNQEE